MPDVELNLRKGWRAASTGYSPQGLHLEILDRWVHRPAGTQRLERGVRRCWNASLGGVKEMSL